MEKKYRTAEVELEGGGRVTIRACPSAVLWSYLRKWADANPEPQPPTRMTKTADGHEEEFELGKDDPLHLEFQKNQIIWQIERLRRHDMAVLTAGVIVDVPEDDAWAEQYVLLGIDIPDKEEDLPDYMYVYMMTVLFPNPDDSKKVVDAILDLSQPKESRIRAKMRGFQSSGMIRNLWMRIFRRVI